jgi:hypothetical protein
MNTRNADCDGERGKTRSTPDFASEGWKSFAKTSFHKNSSLNNKADPGVTTEAAYSRW